jgi:hypothetical protein
MDLALCPLLKCEAPSVSFKKPRAILGPIRISTRRIMTGWLVFDNPSEDVLYAEKALF